MMNTANPKFSDLIEPILPETFDSNENSYNKYFIIWNNVN